MPATPQNRFLPANASKLTSEVAAEAERMSRAAALLTVTNRLERNDVAWLVEAAGKVIGRLATPETVIRASAVLFRKEGYRRIYGHVREVSIHFWQNFAFKLRENGARYAFSDQVFVEMIDKIEPSYTARSRSEDPSLLIRPDGAWHKRASHEASTARQPMHQVSML